MCTICNLQAKRISDAAQLQVVILLFARLFRKLFCWSCIFSLSLGLFGGRGLRFIEPPVATPWSDDRTRLSVMLVQGFIPLPEKL